MFGFRKRTELPSAAQALPGRASPINTAERHFVFDRPLQRPYPDEIRLAAFGMGCFWGAERKFWQLGADCIWITAVVYTGGFTPNPTYEEVCSGLTGHNEVVLVAYNPAKITYAALLKIFWENHNPTQGMRQGGDIGTQYRSGVYTFSKEDQQEAEASKLTYGAALSAQGLDPVTTEILPASELYFAEDYHQQYLAKNPAGYCGLGGTGVACQIGAGVSA